MCRCCAVLCCAVLCCADVQMLCPYANKCVIQHLCSSSSQQQHKTTCQPVSPLALSAERSEFTHVQTCASSGSANTGVPVHWQHGIACVQMSVQMSVNLQAAAEALTDSAPGLPSPFERFSKSMNQFVSGSSGDQDGLQAPTVPEEEELDMSVRSDSIDTSYFDDPGSNGIKLRGSSYLQDKKKVSAGHVRMSCSVNEL